MRIHSHGLLLPPARPNEPALPRPGHPLGTHPLVELRFRDVTERERRFLERRPLAVRFFCDGCGLVVADMRIERGHEHQRALEQLLDARTIGLDPAGAMLIEASHAVAQKTNALKDVMN